MTRDPAPNFAPTCSGTAPTIATLLFRLKGSLSTAHMGTRLYIAGTEGFIGQAMQWRWTSAWIMPFDHHGASRLPGARVFNAFIARASPRMSHP